MCLSELLLEFPRLGLCVYMCLIELLLGSLHVLVCAEVHMMYTVIVSEKEGIVCTLGGCHRWVSEKRNLFWFSLKKCGLHSEKFRDS